MLQSYRQLPELKVTFDFVTFEYLTEPVHLYNNV